MDEFAQLPSEERRLYFEQASVRLGLSAQVIEKDFWVCWTLGRLFSLDEFRGHLTFKGGTTLSKVYRVIERFSEDVDVAIERSFLGFGGDSEPEKGASGKEQQRRIDRLKEVERVAIFKGVYFRAAWAKYEEARPGTLRLMPGPQSIRPLREDYARMAPLFFGEPPRFEDILARLSQLEQRINGSNRSSPIAHGRSDG